MEQTCHLAGLPEFFEELMGVSEFQIDVSSDVSCIFLFLIRSGSFALRLSL